MTLYDPVLQGPLPGPYLEYMTRIIRYKRPSDPPGTLGVETLYCKDAVAQFLGLQLAPPRTGVFANKTSNLNKGATFAKRGDKGSNFYKILLLPFTTIEVFERNRVTGEGETKNYRRSTLGISMNGRVSVAVMREWLIYQVGGAGNKAVRERIKGMVTPSLKTYTWRSELNPKGAIPLPTTPIAFYEGDFSKLPEAQPKPGPQPPPPPPTP